MQVDVVPDHRLGVHGAAYVAAALRAGVAARGRATVAFSGGSAAPPLLNALAEQEVRGRQSTFSRSTRESHRTVTRTAMPRCSGMA